MVSSVLKMNEFDVILGKDFLVKNGIIIDFGRGILYSNPKEVKISFNKRVNSILKSTSNKINGNKETNTKINKVKNGNTSNTFKCMPIDANDTLITHKLQIQSYD